MAVTTDELAGSPTFKFSDGKLTAHRKIKVAWADALTYLEELIPGGFSVGVNTISGVGQQFPGQPNLRVSTVEILPFHQDAVNSGVDVNGVAYHEFAQCEIDYAVPPVGALPDLGTQPLDPKEMLVHQMESGGQFLHIPNTNFKYDADSKKVPDGTIQGIFIGTTEHHIVDHVVENPNWVALETKKGHVNASATYLRGFQNPTECLMYLGYSARQTVMTTGATAWQIGVKISTKIVPAKDSATWGSDYGGHNHFWDEFNQGFFRVVRDDDTPVFPTFDFQTLFQPGSTVNQTV